MPDPTALPQPGDVLHGKYRVEAVLGRGGMGVVYAAVDVSLDRRVALKVLLPEILTHGEAVGRFVREGRAAAKIESTHVARVFEVGTLANGLPFLAMEFLSGQDLEKLLGARGQLTVAEAARIVAEACEALSEAHSLGIVHRDLKPANLFLAQRRDGSATTKVLDFGISKLRDPTAENALTRTTAVMGTAYYMSPEQIRDAKRVGPRSDIWALGVILYEVITGQRPFDGESLPAISVVIAVDAPRPLRELSPATPPPFAAIVERCLTKDPDGRFASADELRDALLAFVSGVPGQTSRSSLSTMPVMPAAATSAQASPLTPAPFAPRPVLAETLANPLVTTRASAPPAGRSRGLLIAAVSVTLLGGTAAVFLLTRGTAPPPVTVTPTADSAPAASPPVPEPSLPSATPAAVPADSAPPPSPPSASKATTTKAPPLTTKVKPNVGSATKSMD